MTGGDATERLWAGLSADDLAAIAVVDAARLAVERERLDPRFRAGLTTPVYALKQRFAMWERLARKMENGWLPSGYYLVDEYVNDLTNRAAISPAIAGLPQALQEKLRCTLSAIDARFDRCTVPDGGAELARWGHQRPADIPPAVWERRPAELPWEH